MSGITWGKPMECPQCKATFEGEMLWPEDIFPNGPQKCCSGQDCCCAGLPVDLPWFQCPTCGHRFEMDLVEVPKPSLKCTWQDPPDKRCERLAAIDHVSKSGETWARLCKEHDKELTDSQTDPISVPLMLQCWVRAGGGSKVMAERMVR